MKPKEPFQESPENDNKTWFGFKDFSQPSVKKTGYLIPLQSGHNGEWSRTEKTLLEVHLVNAGLIEDQSK